MTALPLSFDNLEPAEQERLAALVDEYLAVREEGRPINCEQLVACHPSLAKPLREYLQSLDFLQNAAAGFRAQAELFEPNGRFATSR